MGIDDPEAPFAGRVILLVEIGDGAHQDFPRGQRTAMRDFRQHQSGLFSRASRNRGKGPQERGSSGTKGVVSRERPTLGEGREIAHLTLDDVFDGPSYFW